MGYGMIRAAVGATVLGAAVLLTGCGTVSAGPDEVCVDAERAYEQYVAQVRSVPAAEPARWRQPTESLARRLDELADETRDDDLRTTLRTEADRLRDAAAAVGGGDVAQLNTVISQAPARIGGACD
ncbi:MAG TPA: hypothetical protein VIL71_10940 [Spirillospora sp.]